MKKKLSIISSTLVIAVVVLLGATQSPAAGRVQFSNLKLPSYGNNVTVNTNTRENQSYGYVHFSMYDNSDTNSVNAWVVKSSNKSMLTKKYIIYKGDSNRQLVYSSSVASGTLVEVRIDGRPDGGQISGASNIL